MMQNRAAGRFVCTARLDAHQPVLHQVDLADRVLAAQRGAAAAQVALLAEREPALA